MTSITVGHLIWFRHLAKKRNLDGSACALYHYLVGECLWSDTDTVHLTQEMMASALHVSKSTVNRSLKKLQECRLIQGGDGNYLILLPDEVWLERNYWSRVRAESTPKQDYSPDIPEQNYWDEIQEPDFSDELKAEFGEGYKANFSPDIPEPQEEISDEEMVEKQRAWNEKARQKRAEIAARKVQYHIVP